MAHGGAKNFCSKFCTLNLWILENLCLLSVRNYEQHNVFKLLQLQRDQAKDHSDINSLLTEEVSKGSFALAFQLVVIFHIFFNNTLD